MARVAMSPCDPAAFDSDAAPFSPKQWLNEALSAPAPGGDEEPLELRLSVLLTKLQLSAADVDASVHSSCKELGSISRPVARELGLVSQQAAAVRAELSTLLDEVGSLEERSEASVCHLREGMAITHRTPGIAIRRFAFADPIQWFASRCPILFHFLHVVPLYVQISAVVF